MSMDMGTATSSGAMPTATDHGMGGMEGMGDGCKISVSIALLVRRTQDVITDVLSQMLWNWNTIDSCKHHSLLDTLSCQDSHMTGFISSSWRITSSGMFAGSCIGVLLLVMCLEALRRASREYDAYIVRQYQKTAPPPSSAAARLDGASDDPTKTPSTQSTPLLQPQSFTPNIFQQLVRAFLHMAQFAVAYIVMLLAMYYNGYIIICIFLGAFIGAFIFSWHSMALP